MTQLDVFNRYMVGINTKGDIIITNPPLPGARLTRQQALVFAAYVVALADPDGEEFKQVLQAVKNT